MKDIISIAMALVFTTRIFCQINVADSTVQVIGYWDMNEKQSYIITEEHIKIKGNDTISRDLSKYEVEITVIDSTENSYTIEWYYKNYTTNAQDPVSQKILSLAQDMKVIIETDELGSFQMVTNWEEIRNYMADAINKLKAEFESIPNIDKAFDQVISTFSSKEAIEASTINEIHQYYAFHGVKYSLGEELTAQIKVPNLYGKEPFDCDLTFRLDEINPEENNSVFRMWQIINSSQLTDATYEYVTQIVSSMNGQLPKREDFPPLANETSTASRIHGSGWIIYSVETKEVMAEDSKQIIERIIEII